MGKVLSAFVPLVVQAISLAFPIPPSNPVATISAGVKSRSRHRPRQQNRTETCSTISLRRRNSPEKNMTRGVYRELLSAFWRATLPANQTWTSTPVLACSSNRQLTHHTGKSIIVPIPRHIPNAFAHSECPSDHGPEVGQTLEAGLVHSILGREQAIRT